MSSRFRFPVDVALTAAALPAALATMAMLDGVQRVWRWWLHPTVAGWLFAAGVATLLVIAGAVLLFLAKWRQYREGVFFRIGYAGMTEWERRCYRWALVLLVPACLTMWGLTAVSGMVR